MREVILENWTIKESLAFVGEWMSFFAFAHIFLLVVAVKILHDIYTLKKQITQGHEDLAKIIKK